jgi:uncharacterized protein (DUF362 family)
VQRRSFVKLTVAGAALLPFSGCGPSSGTPEPPASGRSDLFQIEQIPETAVTDTDHHVGIDELVAEMGRRGLKFYRTAGSSGEGGGSGLIAASDVVLIKVNAQWKYRGCTNSDVVQGLVQKILEHPDGFYGEVVIIENGQGRGSLACDTSSSYGNAEVHANAQDESHSFLWLVEHFDDPRVSARLLDPIGATFIGADDHATDGYRRLENVSYPCFTTAGGRRVELREGVWTGSSHGSNLKLINVPVLKHHDVGGSEITASLKHMYGLVSMSDGQVNLRHYAGLGETCGRMMASVRTPVLNILDCIWVSYLSLDGHPGSSPYRANRIVASQDPVALDYWAAKYVLYPIDHNERHEPTFSGIRSWLAAARSTIIGLGGLADASQGIVVDSPTMTEAEMTVYTAIPGAG